jgi:hypothetical protein
MMSDMSGDPSRPCRARSMYMTSFPWQRFSLAAFYRRFRAHNHESYLNQSSSPYPQQLSEIDPACQVGPPPA